MNTVYPTYPTYPSMNLQLFASQSEEKVIPPVVPEIEEEEEAEEVEEVEEPETEEPEEEPVTAPVKDKKTSAIIREKQQNKMLKQKIAELEKEREKEKVDNAYRKTLTEKGFSEEEIEEKVSLRREIDENKTELERQKYERQADKLATKYPDVHDYLPEFIKIVNGSKGLLTLEEVCKAKLGDSNEYEIRTKAEQEALINRKNAVAKKTVVGEQKNTGAVKFSAEDESAYQYYLSKNPGASRKTYSEILKIRKG